jgi:hypothetical protein
MRLINLNFIFFYIKEGLEEDKLNEFDNIAYDQSNLSSPQKTHTSVSRQFVRASSVDESLHDEDAWMSILDVVNAEVNISHLEILFYILYILYLACCTQ